MSLSDRPTAGRGAPFEVFTAFLRLGLTSFGGPVAHLGYFRGAFVDRRRWLDDTAFADLVALCQFLPGPASSQVGFAIGMMRAGLPGALAAWAGFTLPSALLMIAFALGVGQLSGRWEGGAIHGLKLAAVAVVAQAVWGMARTLAPDARRASFAGLGLVTVTLVGGGWGQLAALVIGAGLGLTLLKSTPEAQLPATGARLPISPAMSAACLVAFTALLVVPPLLEGVAHNRIFEVADAFYQSGAMVFGGGHVVLPLLQAKVVQPGWVDSGRFLSGYALAQALPGPLFSFAAYLGAIIRPGPAGLAGAILALLAIFLPGLLILTGVAPFWSRVRENPGAQGAIHGTNAAVVGILAAALYNPVWISAVLSPLDFAVAVVAFAGLTVWRLPPIAVVAGCAAIGAAATAWPA